MKNTGLILVTLLALAAAACGTSGTAEVPEDVVVPADGVVACLGDSECSQFEAHGQCVVFACVDGACQEVSVEDGTVCDDGNGCTEADQCVAGQCQGTVKDCSDGNDCTEDSCDPKSGTCETTFLLTACDDQNVCTHDDACSEGVCLGEPITCNDGEACTEDGCDPTTGCVFPPVANGTACDDHDLCTNSDECQGGVCLGDVNPDCVCEVDEDCQEFEDGNLCNGTLTCAEGICKVDGATVVTCPEAPSVCQKNKCNSNTGACELESTLDGTDCDDANACTKDDYCSGGICKGLPEDCDDKKACTVDTCDPDEGCKYEAKDGICGDGDPCTLNDHCENGTCVGDPDPLCQCDVDEDCFDLDDDDLCNGTLICKDNQCIVALDTVVDCDMPGLNDCMLSVCVPETGFCDVSQSPDGLKCDDKNACTGEDTCYEGICKGLPLYCDDGNVCTLDSCDPNKGCVFLYNNEAACNDGNDCTDEDFCSDGICIGVPDPSCVCQSDDDCLESEDGNYCNGVLICVGFKCVVDQDSIVQCDKSGDTGCLVTYCVPETGDCVQAAFEDGKPCSDGDACSLVDVCLDGICTGSGTPDCDDGNTCTDDVCDPQLGCITAFNDEDCDDGDTCTGGDYCDQGVCVPGSEDLCGGTSCLPAWFLGCNDNDGWGTDATGATNLVDKYSCSEWDYYGPEYAYTFTVDYDAKVTVTLSQEEVELDIIVLENMGEGCDPEACRAFGMDSVEFDAKAGVTYFLVVDEYEFGVPTGGGAYVISTECTPLHETDCSNGVDEDKDGDLDCEDDDCIDAEECLPDLCTPDWTLDCGGSDHWANYEFGSTDEVGEYECSPFAYPGPEYAYVWVAPFTKTVTVRLSDETSETDVIVLADAGDNVCDPQNCLGYGLDEVQFQAVAGTTYYFVVDGYNGEMGWYTIALECPLDVELDCEDGDDDDGDGMTDCDDDDCALNDACVDDCNPWWFPKEAGCGYEDDYNNYGLFATNKADSYVCTEDAMTGPEYVYEFLAPVDATVTVSLTEETGDTDILVVKVGEDWECLTNNCIAHGLSEVTFEAEGGKWYYFIVDGFDGAQGSFHLSVDCLPVTELDCTDGMDDDFDGLTDCMDSDCFPGPACEPACVPDDVEFAQLSCGSTDLWSNNGNGSTDLIEEYQCSAWTYEGPEYVYTLTVDETSTVTVKLSGETAETDVIVLVDDGLGCNPASCIGWGLTEFTFDADPAVVYYVVVDGWAGAEGEYNLDVTCN